MIHLIHQTKMHCLFLTPPPDLLEYLMETACPGIYHLLLRDEVVYVGQSTNVMARVLTHLGDASKEFDSFRFRKVSQRDLDFEEARDIWFFSPRLNRKVPSLPGWITENKARSAIMKVTGGPPDAALEAMTPHTVCGFRYYQTCEVESFVINELVRLNGDGLSQAIIHQALEMIGLR